MVLEATMIVIDNSEYMRNGDYTPTRFEAQENAVGLIFQAKTQSNPENTVGLMTLGGSGPEVKVTLSSDIGKILAGLHDTKVYGETHLSTGIQVAALALKHRLNKLQKQRVIAFIGSPIRDDSKDLIRLAKKMKKNGVAVDFINFGEQADNTDTLERFIKDVNSSDNSHLLTVPPGSGNLSDVIVSSPIINEDGGAGVGAGLGGGSGSEMFEFGGVDPSMDPELALALRMSLEDEQARQEKLRVDAEKADKPETIPEEGPSSAQDKSKDDMDTS